MVVINIGSKNPIKVIAVKNAFSNYFDNVEVKSVDVSSGVSHTPMTSKECLTGAKNRAEKVFSDCDFSVGIEGGFIEFPNESGHILSSITAIYDGEKFHIGGSPLLNLPKKVVDQVLEGKELGDIFDELTGIKNHKQKGGAVDFLTKGVFPRQKALELGVVLALASILNKQYY